MPNHVTHVLEASPRVVARFLVPITPEETAASLAEAQRILELQHARKEELDEVGEVVFAERNGRYMLDALPRWITEAEENLETLQTNPPTYRLSFSGVVPEPENIETGGCGHILTSVAPGELEADGVVCWYKWNRVAWGTKWDMYTTALAHVEGSPRIRLSFETAWSTPEPVITTLKEFYPDEEIHVLYADEDTGNNYGFYGGFDPDDEEFAAQRLDDGTYDQDVNALLATVIQNHDADPVEALVERRRFALEYDEETSLPEEDQLPELVKAAQVMLLEKSGIDLCRATSPMMVQDLVVLMMSVNDTTKLIENSK